MATGLRTMPLHPNCEVVRSILGAWKGEGKGYYPTIKDFKYGELTEFGHAGKPFISYSQKSWRLSDGMPMHYESGYLRFPGGGKVEAVISQPTGVQEVSEGTVEVRRAAGSSEPTGLIITLEAKEKAITRTPTAKAPHVTALRRVLTFEKDTFSYTFSMATTTHAEMTQHLDAVLTRQPQPAADSAEEGKAAAAPAAAAGATA